MKQNWWLLSSAALLGGGVALIGSALLQMNAGVNLGNGIPTHQVSYSGSVVGDMNADFVGAADRSVNCVVHVKTESTVSPAYNPWFDFFGYQQQPQVQQGTGSGVIISNDGYIITNNNVVEGAQKLIVTLNNNKNYTAELE